jgi:hypothetical protein
MHEVEIDLYRDWIQSSRNELIAWGYDLTKLRTDQDIARCYLNVEWRRIRREPRVILKASDFTCPPEKAAGLAELELKVLAGQDLLPHLSRGLMKIKYNDALLNDWGVYHLHLGTQLDRDGFVERRGRDGNLVLFACFDGSAAYFLRVMEHGKWSDQSLVQTLHDNWPSLIEGARLKGVQGKERRLTDDEIRLARSKGLSVMVLVGDGTVYQPLAGGYASSRLSSVVVVEADRRKRLLDAWTHSIIEQIDVIAAKAEAQGVKVPHRLTFELQEESGKAQAFERSCKLAVPFGKLWS